MSDERLGKMEITVNWLNVCLILVFCNNVFSSDIPGETVDSNSTVFDMSLDELLNLNVSVASKKAESQWEAPGIVSVVPREEFEIYGDRNLQQLMQRQPSVYTRDMEIIVLLFGVICRLLMRCIP